MILSHQLFWSIIDLNSRQSETDVRKRRRKDRVRRELKDTQGDLGLGAGTWERSLIIKDKTIIPSLKSSRSNLNVHVHK